MNSPAVSVIIPTRNRAAWLPLAVQSAWEAAAELSVEVIVVDDASEDATPELCAGWPAVQTLRAPQRLGLAGARNLGVRAARGEYIALLDDDDLRLPGSLPALLTALCGDPGAALAYGQMQLAANDTALPTGQVRPRHCPAGDVFWDLLRWNFVPVLATLARREALLAAGLFDVSLGEVEDWDLWLRLCERQPVAALAQPVALYRQPARDSGQLSSDPARMWRTAARVQARALRLPRALAAPIDQRRSTRRAFLEKATRRLLLSATHSLLLGEAAAARRILASALTLAPRTLLRQPGLACAIRLSWLRNELSVRHRRTLKRCRRVLQAAELASESPLARGFPTSLVQPA